MVLLQQLDFCGKKLGGRGVGENGVVYPVRVRWQDVCESRFPFAIGRNAVNCLSFMLSYLPYIWNGYKSTKRADLILHDPGEFGLHYFFHH